MVKTFLSSVKTKVATKFPKKLFFFFLKIGLALKELINYRIRLINFQFHFYNLGILVPTVLYGVVNH